MEGKIDRNCIDYSQIDNNSYVFKDLDSMMIAKNAIEIPKNRILSRWKRRSLFSMIRRIILEFKITDHFVTKI